MVADNDRVLKPWRKTLEHYLRAAKPSDWQASGAMAVSLKFWMPRPLSHRDRMGDVRKSAPVWSRVRPDIDKLARACLDALTDARVWSDDGQCAMLWVLKQYAADDASTGVFIRVWPIGAWCS